MAAARKPNEAINDNASAAGEPHAVLIGLSAAIVSVTEERPRVLVVHRSEGADALPFGTFDPLSHRTLESGLRNWVEEQTRLRLGYVEQLYTFGDRGRHLIRAGEGPRVLSVGYLALTRPQMDRGPETLWRDWYGYFPWEDWRERKPPILESLITPRLAQFVAAASNPELRNARQDRVQLCFGKDGGGWDEEKVLERYELLYEAGLVREAQRDRQAEPAGGPVPPLGAAMEFDHRRILATAMGRLRGKMKYRPVVFELMPPEFTLLELQRTVEALSGIRLHKQNFRRLVEAQGLVEGTGRLSR
ncbi:MAG TPA: hypothetical protein VHT51_15015, partial [Micropepsaceae bacterium]|nr:hypothetical protein [Micropepsaceae bacterium]